MRCLRLSDVAFVPYALWLFITLPITAESGRKEGIVQ